MLNGLDVQHVVGDIHDHEALCAAMRGCDVVLHAAAYYPPRSVNLRSSVRQAVAEMRGVLSAAAEAGIGRLVYTSTLTTVGRPGDADRLADERDFYVPGSTGSAYFESKWAMEAEAWRAAAEGLPVVIVNPTAVFGPWDVKPTTGEILITAAKGQIPVWLDVQLNIVDARDVGRGQVLAAERGRTGQRYILGGDNVPLREALTMAAEESGGRPPRRQLSLGAFEAIARAAEAAGRLPLVNRLPLHHVETVRNLRALDTSKARHELGFESRPVRDTVRDTLAWFGEHGYLRAAG
jgi:dihydroflavonol-4-reductase